MNENRLEMIIVTPENVSEHSKNIEKIYRKGYKFNNETKKGDHPLNFLYNSESIEKAVKTKGLLKWMYLVDNNNPVFACIGLYDNYAAELLGVVNDPDYRGKGNYLNIISNNMNDFAVSIFNEGVGMLVNEIQLTAKPILFNALQTKTTPVGFTPNARKIGNTFGISRMSMYNLFIYPSKYFRGNEIVNMQCALTKRVPIDYIIPELKELSENICNNLGFPTPKIIDKKTKNEKTNVSSSELFCCNELFFNEKQSFFVPDSHNSCSVFGLHNDNSCSISGINMIDSMYLDSLIKDILEKNNKKEAIMVDKVQDWKHQRILFDNGFIPVSFIPSGFNYKDNVSMIRLKDFRSSDYSKIIEIHSKNMDFLDTLRMEKYPLDRKRKESFELYKSLPEIILSKIQ